MGMVRDPEPFPSLLNQGTITKGGKRMSKSRGNLVSPAEAFELYGADSLRLYMLFSGPPEQDFDWPEEGVTSIGRVTYPWVQRVWRLCEESREADRAEGSLGEAEGTLRKHLHKTIKVVTRDYESFSFNTAIARMMELVNDTYRYRAAGGTNAVVMREVIEALLLMLAPMAPYLAEEQWRRQGHDASIHQTTWPTFDEELAREEEVMMVVQVNGKVRDTIPVAPDITEDEMREKALASEKIQAHLNGGEPRKIITKPPKLISLVVPKP
jgi:leucyl-tRNA synthetase